MDIYGLDLSVIGLVFALPFGLVLATMRQIRTKWLFVALLSYPAWYGASFMAPAFWPSFPSDRVLQGSVLALLVAVMTRELLVRGKGGIRDIMQSRMPELNIAILVFGLWSLIAFCIGILNGNFVRWALGDLYRYSQLVFGYFITLAFVGFDEIREYMRSAVNVAIVAAGVLIYLAFIVIQNPRFYNFISPGFAALLFLPFMIAVEMKRSQSVSIRLWFKIVILLSSLILTFTRTLWIAAAGGMLLLAVVYTLFLRSWHQAIVSLSILLLLLICITQGFLPSQPSVVPSQPSEFFSLSLLLRDPSVQTRLEEALNVLRAWEESPLLGKGFGATFPLGPLNKQLAELQNKTVGQDSHNMYLELLLYTGVVGLVSWGLILLLFLRTSLGVLRSGGRDEADAQALILYFLAATVSLAIASLAAASMLGNGISVMVGCILAGAERFCVDIREKRTLKVEI